MKKKLLGILLTVVLILSFGLVTAPVMAADLPYEAVGTCPTDITIDLVDDSVVWTIDIDMVNAPVASNHKIGYALVISLDHMEPAFQIHSNDGVDSTYAWGTHLYSEYVDGWHTGDTNTLVSDLNWVDATGAYKVADNPDGIFTVAIDKANLAPEFYWGVAIFADTSDTRYPVEWQGWSGNASTYATYTIPGAAATATTEVLGDLIQISINPTSLDFGPAYPGKSSLPQILSIQNTGSVDVDVSASSPSSFYANNLRIDDGVLSGWLLLGLLSGDPVGSGEIRGVKLQVVLPPDASPGIKTGTIIFWAEEAIATP